MQVPEPGQFDAYLGRTDEANDVCALPLVERVALLLDRDPSAYRDGDELPTGWHACVFTPRLRQSELREDGHARSEPLVPALDFPRRMLGGRRTYYHRPIVIGSRLHRKSEIASITPKSGRSGQLVIVTVRHSIFAEGDEEPRIVEEQDSIFREEAKPGGAAKGGAPGATAPQPEEPEISRDLETDPRMLFRYSAITFNTHRIHYDLPYAREREGYPGLVVNGGLASLLLTDFLEQHLSRRIRSFEARNKGAIFCGRPIRLCGAPRGDGWRLWVEDEDRKNLLEADVT